MGDAIIARLSSTPWAKALVNDPKWTPTRTDSRLPKGSGEDSFFAETLSTNRTIRAFLTLRPVKEEGDDFPFKEIVTIIELGDGLNGHPRIAHGGFAATMLDEACGVLIGLNLDKKSERLRDLGQLDANTRMSSFTAYLNTNYKKPIPTPGFLLCTAKIERQDGRKLFIRASIEDGKGTVFTTGEAMFVEVKTNL
ncbi:Nn.00g087610.m01.CDS01 [Neocucurbitaria sp. VM-36]